MSGESRSRGGFGARTIPNIIAVARREITYRARTRAYRFTTVLLVVAGVALASAPSIITALTQGDQGDRIEVVVGDTNPPFDVATLLAATLNAAAAGGVPISGDEQPINTYRVVYAPDVATARADVVAGDAAAALALTRDASGDLAFELFSSDSLLSRRTQLIHQAVIAVAIPDRLVRAGIPLGEQARLSVPPAFTLTPADPDAVDKPGSSVDAASSFITTFGLSIAIFMAIILYGQWIAFSVVEEKSSRIMEVVLAAATPFQLLSGKVIGVGALAILQYLIVGVPTILAVIFQRQIAALILGGSAPAAEVPAGLSIGMLAAFGVMFVLGFALYSTLYAGAASLISRQEDVNQIVAPLSFISVAGYLVAVYSASGIIDIESPLVVGLSFVPFFAPYLMLMRLGLGAAQPLEVIVAVVLLALTVPIALWVAARLYRSGVLLYGQRPSPIALIRAIRAR